VTNETVELFTVEQACTALGIKRNTIYRLMNTGKLRSVQIGRARRIPRSAITDFVSGLQQTGPLPSPPQDARMLSGTRLSRKSKVTTP